MSDAESQMVDAGQIQ